MKAMLTLFLVLISASVTRGATDEGTVASVDGKGSFEVRTTQREILVLHANPDLMADKLEFKTREWPHLYKDIKPGDVVSFNWYRDEKTGKNIARFVGIKKRGG